MPRILKEFLNSLQQLDQSGIIIDYMFIDDNESEESSRLLEQFSDGHRVIIEKSNRVDSYICNEETHLWKEHLIWKVAEFKNKIIQRAIENDYDYLFFIDSDLLIHPKTIGHLIDTKKDIISTIFWTKWDPSLPELPQVWMTDQYTIFEKERGEDLTKEESLIRQQHFLDKLKIPGIYEIGGLGACTLISREALLKGVNFSEIKNVSFWGEDRHFCIRAVAFGLSLFVDTHYPAFHIYRESELAGVSEYKKICGYKETNDVHIQITEQSNLTLSMVLKNEAGRYLRQVLEEHRHYIDKAVIIDDGSSDNSVEICKEVLSGIPIHIVRNDNSKFSNEIELRKQQWEETVKTNPEWILNLDADEIFEERFKTEVRSLMNQREIDVYNFRLYDFWNEQHYREDQYWCAHLTFRPFLVRYNHQFQYEWRETPQHCGRFPINIGKLPSANSSLRLKHFGWANLKDRINKYYRYLEHDPEGKYGWKEQYQSILDVKPKLIKWV